MSVYSFIADHTLLTAVLTIGLFFGISIMMTRDSNKQSLSQSTQSVAHVISTNKGVEINQAADTFGNRMKRGFGVLIEKANSGLQTVRDSQFVKNIQEEQTTAKFDDMLPKGLSGEQDNEDKVEDDAEDKSKSSKKKPMLSRDPFTTNLSEMSDGSI